jgi:DNA-binding transcriptional ArsR family regulator
MSDKARAPFPDSEVAKDTLFDLLSSPRRRFILYYLHEVSPETTLQDLADEVGAWEYDKAVEDLTRQESKRVYVSLYQTHIPKLAQSGIIEYDSDTGEISLTDHVDEFGPYLGWEERSRSWQPIYLGLAAVSIVLYGLVTFDVGPFAAISEVVAGLGIVGAFVIVAMWHHIASRGASVRMPSDLIEER